MSLCRSAIVDTKGVLAGIKLGRGGFFYVEIKYSFELCVSLLISMFLS